MLSCPIRGKPQVWLQQASVCGLPRGVIGFAVAMVSSALLLMARRQADEANALEVLAQYGVPPGTPRNALIPNAQHVWWARELFWVRGMGGGINTFGYQLARNEFNWTKVCRLDSNGDGITNGRHLGDPCCSWKPNVGHFALDNAYEYRRWHISHPAVHFDRTTSVPSNESTLQDEPLECDHYDGATYRQQFTQFYFRKAADGVSNVPFTGVKIFALAAIVAIAGDWIFHKGLLQDAFPFLFRSATLPIHVSGLICAASFLYMDLTSGVIHLILDYAPKELPLLGILANGFQYHHDDPTAIIRITWFEYVSHIHVLIPLIYVSVVLSDATRVQRLFWAWGGVWAHVFQTAHRWAHMPEDWLPSTVRTLQSSGLLLSHEQHMRHHQDLEHQFTILSGHTDVILDTVVRWVPPSRYDLWFLFGVFWFLLPIVLDVRCRSTEAHGAFKTLKCKVEVEAHP